MASSAALYRVVSFSANCTRYGSCRFSELKIPRSTLLRPSSGSSKSPSVVVGRQLLSPSPKMCNISRHIRNLSEQAEQIRKSNKAESSVDNNETEATPIVESSGSTLPSQSQQSPEVGA